MRSSTSRAVGGLAAASGVVLSSPLSDFAAGSIAGSFDFAGSPRWQPAVIANARKTAAIAAPRSGNVSK